jgi:hypothetical protein
MGGRNERGGQVFLRASIPIGQQIDQCIRDNRRKNMTEVIYEMCLEVEGNHFVMIWSRKLWTSDEMT